MSSQREQYASVKRRTGFGIPIDVPSPTSDEVEQLLELTYDHNPYARRVAVKNLCPCHASLTDDVVERLFELTNDPFPGVRTDALHNLTDGLPSAYDDRIKQRVAEMRADANPKVRRCAEYLFERQQRLGRADVG